jgi:type IV secretion system protein VirB9
MKLHTIQFAILFMAAIAAMAQQPSTQPPVPPPAAAFQQAAAIADGQSPGVPVPPPPATHLQVKKTPAKKAEDLPLQVSREAPLPPNSRAALAMSQNLLNGDPQAHEAKDGHVVFNFGNGTPTVLCALLQVTEIDFEPGETVGKEAVDVGDTVEINYAVRHAGTGVKSFDYLILRPTAAGIDTTMTVGTDRRVYYFRLRSTENQFVAHASFAYPADEEEHKKQALQEAMLAKAAAFASQAKLEALAPVRTPHVWKYSVEAKGRDAHYYLPSSVSDDGIQTYIQLTQQARSHGLPVLEIEGATGPLPANTHWEDNRLVVDALFTRGCLLQGVGRKQQRVCINNDTEKGGK